MGKMRGGIRPRGDGWQAQVYVGRDPATGKKRYIYAAFRTRKEAERWRTQKLRELHETGEVFEPADTLLGEYLTTWLNTIRSSVRPSTYTRYERVTRLYILPALGKVPLNRITATRIQAMYNDLRDQVGSRTLLYVHQTLHRALEQAVKLDLIRQNPARRVEKPRHYPAERAALSPSEIARFLEVARNHRLVALWMLACTTGMRRGELCGLRWQDVDLVNGRLTVTQQLTDVDGKLMFLPPKTAAGKRTIPLLPEVVEALAAHKTRQDVEKAMAGGKWPAGELVFTSTNGQPLRPNNLLRRDFKRLLKEAGLPVTTTFHALRHSVATALAAQGVHPKAAQALLGHSHVQVTLGVYTHHATGMTEEAVQRLRHLLPKDEGR